MPAAEVVDLPRHGHDFSALIEPESYIERLDLEKIFARRAPLHVDLGCGDGSFLCALAQRVPEKNFLGVERLLGRARSAARKAGPSRTGGKIDNVRVLRMEIFYAVRYLLPPVSVETFYLMFPDPWPKRRHQRRRVVNEHFLNAVSDALVKNGLLHIATDQLDYFAQIKRLVSELDRLKRSSSAGFEIDLRDVDLPPTKFEKRFREQGAPIHGLLLRKVSPVT